VAKKKKKSRYTLIRGSYHTLYLDLPKNGPQPDGDTINFLPDNDDLVQNLNFSGRSVERKHLGTYTCASTPSNHFMNRRQKLDGAGIELQYLPEDLMFEPDPA